jgi:FkbM family methyltransferase
MGILAAKGERLATIGALLSRHAVGPGSQLALLSAYASTLRTTTSKKEVGFLLRIKSTVYPFHMRQSDVFVLEEILLQGQYELESSVRPTPTIIDAGANIGVSALWLLACHPGATLHAFEPEPANFRLLRANIGSIDRVSVEQLAIGAATSTVTLNLADHGAMHSLKAVAADDKHSVTVDCIRLADYLALKEIDHVDLLKIDVEGSERDLLTGLGDRLDAVQVIVGELHETLVDEAEFYRYLEGRGFRRVRKEYYGSGKAEGVHVFEVAR